MRIEDLDFELPEGLIAQRPASRRGDARMLRVDSATAHCFARDLPEEIGDALVVLNDSKVVPARLRLTRARDGRAFELLICDPHEAGAPGDTLRAWVRGAKKLRAGDRLELGELALVYREPDEQDPRARRFELADGSLMGVLVALGEVPLPPYIRREEGADDADVARYQSVFAKHRGSVAAPTAGLHFDEAALAKIEPAYITLHVGPGTFLPIESEDPSTHQVGSERYSISESAATRIEQAREQGRPILAVGTTVTRTLESVAREQGGRIVAGAGSTDFVITPGHDFAVVGRLLTNFHLPRSSLLMLTCSFGGRERVLSAYREAVQEGYRFYSYGDCMLLSRDPKAPGLGHKE